MRFYAKLIFLIVVFIGLSSALARELGSDWAYAVRVKYVLTFGSAGDYERLIDDTGRALMARAGRADVDEFGKRYRALLDQRLAEAARRNIPLTDDQIVEIRQQCAREAYDWR